MMLECSPYECELLTRAAFLHHEDKGHTTLTHFGILKGLTVAIPNLFIYLVSKSLTKYAVNMRIKVPAIFQLLVSHMDIYL